MGTKDNPGPFDCSAAAEPNEPLFTLLARDPAAPGLVELWAAHRAGDIRDMVRAFAALVQTVRAVGPTDALAKADEASRTAQAMREWLGRDALPVVPEPPWFPGAADGANAKRTGWYAYFAGKSREQHPFPPARIDLHAAFAEGHDRAHEAFPDWPLWTNKA